MAKNSKTRLSVMTCRVVICLIGAAFTVFTASATTIQQQPGPTQLAAPTRAHHWPAPATRGYVSIDGANVYYEEQGKGVPIVLNPGYRDSIETVRPLAAKLADKYRVIGWEHANIGRSDVVFKGSRDIDLWSDQLAELLKHLNARPAYLVGTSSGARAALVTALRYPDVVRGVFVFLVAGASDALAKTLSSQYYGDYADIAEKDGMEAVARQTFWAQQIKLNPRNRERLLKMDRDEFIRVMRRWVVGFRGNDPIMQFSADDLRRLHATGISIRIIAGCDAAHPRDRSELMAKLMPRAELVDSPGFCDDWAPRAKEASAWARQRGELLSQPYYEVAQLPALVDEFVRKTETNLRK